MTWHSLLPLPLPPLRPEVPQPTQRQADCGPSLPAARAARRVWRGSKGDRQLKGLAKGSKRQCPCHPSSGAWGAPPAETSRPRSPLPSCRPHLLLGRWLRGRRPHPQAAPPKPWVFLEGRRGLLGGGRDLGWGDGQYRRCAPSWRPSPPAAAPARPARLPACLFGSRLQHPPSPTPGTRASARARPP